MRIMRSNYGFYSFFGLHGVCSVGSVGGVRGVNGVSGVCLDLCWFKGSNRLFLFFSFLSGPSKLNAVHFLEDVHHNVSKHGDRKHQYHIPAP